MPRRVAILVLVAAVILAGVTACPRGAAACSMVQQANHECCGAHLSLRTRDCCGGAKQLPTPALTSVLSGHTDHHPVTVVVTSALQLVPPAACGFPGARRSCRDQGLAPPDTLVTRHSLLLL